MLLIFLLIECHLLSYEYAWFKVDAIFGQRFASQFPNQLRLCDSICNCGNYPSTTGGMFPDGIDLIMEPQQVVNYIHT